MSVAFTHCANRHLSRLSADATSRRQFMQGISALGVVAALSSTVSGCGLVADKPITIAAHKWVGYEPIFLAHREGWVDQSLVRLHETNAATESMQLLAEGKVDGAALTLDEAFTARQSGQKLTAVMIFNISAGADMVVARPNITTLAELKGHRVGFEHSSVGELLLSEVLRKAGLTRTDIHPVSINIDKHLAAWQRKDVDALVTYEPVAGELLALGGIKLFDSRQIPNTILDVLVMRTDLLDSHANAIRQLTQSHFKALDHLTRNPQDAAYRMAEHLKLSAADVLPAFKGLVLPNAANNHRLLDGTTPELLATARHVSTVMTRSGLLAQEDSLQDLIRADFLPADTAFK